MYYIVFDLEFNQDFSLHSFDKKQLCPFEIIQIGAIKLDQDFTTIETFNRLVKPVIYQEVSPFITELTGITSEHLISQNTFPHIYNEYLDFLCEKDSIFCIWGMSDMKELFRNVKYHGLNENTLPEQFINLQPYVSAYFKLPQSKLLKLQTATELFQIPMPYEFHNALHDAYYTAEIMKKLKNADLKPQHYDPNYIKIRPKQQKKVIDTEMLLQQFEKMYDRKLNEEEQNMIILAYKMGKTHQFIK